MSNPGVIVAFAQRLIGESDTLNPTPLATQPLHERLFDDAALVAELTAMVRDQATCDAMIAELNADLDALAAGPVDEPLGKRAAIAIEAADPVERVHATDPAVASPAFVVRSSVETLLSPEAFMWMAALTALCVRIKIQKHRDGTTTWSVSFDPKEAVGPFLSRLEAFMRGRGPDDGAAARLERGVVEAAEADPARARADGGA